MPATKKLPRPSAAPTAEYAPPAADAKPNNAAVANARPIFLRHGRADVRLSLADAECLAAGLAAAIRLARAAAKGAGRG